MANLKPLPTTLVAALAAVGAAAAIAGCGSASEKVSLSCQATGLENVKGATATVEVGGTVDGEDKDIGTCKSAAAVVKTVTAEKAEMPVSAEGFDCTPSVLSTSPDVVKWSCDYKGADTDSEVTLNFQVTYKS